MRLLNIEFQKVIYNRIFWILLGAYLLLFTLFTMASGDFSFSADGQDASGAGPSFLQFPGIWHNISYLSSIASLFIPVFIVVMLIGNEFTYRTLRQHLIDGLRIEEFLTGKIMFIILFTLFLTLVTAIGGLLVGISNTEDVSMKLMMENTGFLGGFFVQTFGYLVLAFMLGLVLKKPIFAAGAFVMYYWFDKIVGWVSEGKWIDFMPFRSLHNVVQNPAAEVIGQPVQEAISLAEAGIAGGWIVLMIAACYALLRFRDH